MQQLQEHEHHPRPAPRRRIGPGREGGAGRRHRTVDLGRTGQSHLSGDGASGRIGHALLTAGSARAVLTVDEMGYLGAAHGYLQKGRGRGQGPSVAAARAAAGVVACKQKFRLPGIETRRTLSLGSGSRRHKTERLN